MASIRPYDPNDPSKGFIADTGKRGPGARKLCKTLEDAEAYLHAREKNPKPAKVLYEREAELMDCYDRLVAVGASFRQAVDFFITHGARKGNPKFSVLVEKVLAEKRKAQRSADYLDTLRKCAARLSEYLKDDPYTKDISSEQLTDFFYVEHKKTSNGYRLCIFRHLDVVFRYAKKHRLIVENPLDCVERLPRHKHNPPKAISPRDLQLLLNNCYTRKWYDRLSVFVLIAFVGIRKKEITRLNWDSIDFKKREVTVRGDQTKAGHTFRTLRIPDNAMDWLELIRDKRLSQKNIIGPKWESHLRTAVDSLKIPSSRNFIRNAFPSYALEIGWEESLVKKHMGHQKNSSIVWEHYIAPVDKQQAKAFWAIKPTRVYLKPLYDKFKKSPVFKKHLKSVPGEKTPIVHEGTDFLPDDVDITVN